MNERIEPFDDSTELATSGSVTASDVESKNLVAALDLSKSVMVKFPAGSSGEYAERVFSQAKDLSAYDRMAVSMKSFRKGRGQFRGIDDFEYKLDLGAGKAFWLPVWSTLNDATLDISGISSAERIRLTALHSDSDYVVLSNAVAYKAEPSRDIFEGLKASLELALQELYGGGVAVATGTFSGSVGDKSVDLDSPGFVERYAVVKISGGGNSETHNLEREGSGSFGLGHLFDGPALLNDYSAADVTLLLPVSFGRWETEILLPGVVLWGLAPVPVLRGDTRTERLLHWDGSEFTFAAEGKISSWHVAIDAVARHHELVAKMSRAIRRALSWNVVYINGRPHDILYDDAPVEPEPTEGAEEIYRVQYYVDVEAKEEIWTPRKLSKVIQSTLEATIRTS